MLHLAKRRGVHNVIEMVEEDTGNELSTKEQISRNSKALEKEVCCRITVGTFENRR